MHLHAYDIHTNKHAYANKNNFSNYKKREGFGGKVPFPEEPEFISE